MRSRRPYMGPPGNCRRVFFCVFHLGAKWNAPGAMGNLQILIQIHRAAQNLIKIAERRENNYSDINRKLSKISHGGEDITTIAF